ncbi:amidohydrolase [uncultured Endozoicomonas sp.]|uniref:amidohydrolase n=1 Tax=uncultured Endozoicomonas sp. TaxID=432652 RepID=UPI002615F97B|nr:amidohydrolase [uncultured Endozoicomonas sp.]
MIINRDIIADISRDMTEIRHTIHRNPETGFKEESTSALVIRILEKYDINITTGLGKTGVVATITGTQPGREILLRCDMDALNVIEDTNLPYASENCGVMHACGHDGHTAIMLGVATYLAQHRDFSGKVHLIFQPAEERFAGALAVINDGLFTRFPEIDAVYGVHNWPGIPAGTIASRPGPLMACGGSWRMVIKGTGGHGAMPHQTTDPTVALGAIITNIQSIVSRNVSPVDAAVLSIAHIHAGDPDVRNVIPSEVIMSGTCRAYDNNVHSMVFERLKEVAEKTAAVYNCAAEVEVQYGYPAVVNDSEKMKVAEAAAMNTVGAQWDGDIKPVTPSEDFSYYQQKVPGVFAFIGNGESAALHTPKYDFNDNIIPLGIEYFLNIVKLELN